MITNIPQISSTSRLWYVSIVVCGLLQLGTQADRVASTWIIESCAVGGESMVSHAVVLKASNRKWNINSVPISLAKTSHMFILEFNREHLSQVQQPFFAEGQIEDISGSIRICCNYSPMSLRHKSNHRQHPVQTYENHSWIISYSKTGSRSGLAHEP